MAIATVPLELKAYLALFLIVFIPPILIVLAIKFASSNFAWKNVFIVGGICLASFLVIVALCTRNFVNVENGKLKLTIGAIYNEEYALTELDLVAAKTGSLSQYSEYEPVARTNGFGMPWYRGGWFTLRNQDKGLLMVTSADSVLVLPIKGKNTAVIVSVSNPAEVLQQLLRM